MSAPVLFLDRDGTINVDLMHEYLSDPARVILISGVAEAIFRAKDHGFKIAIITNQAGVAKGLTPKEALPKIHAHMEELIARSAHRPTGSFHFDDIRVCMHHPDEKCACRKPGTKMLEESAEALKADPKKSFFIGDRETDLLCAQKYGIPAILVLTGHGEKTQALLATRPDIKPAAIAASLSEAVDFAMRLV